MPKRKASYDDNYSYSLSLGSAYSGSHSASAGLSSNPIVLDSPHKPNHATSAPSAKKPRKKKDPDAPLPEKRGARIRKSLPHDILVRAQRVMDQRFFMVDRQRHESSLGETFSVLGSTGNVYTVVIAQKPTCNCPDATKGNHCKHIIFIYLKVLHVGRASPHWYQKALLKSELEEIFAVAPPAPTSVANDHIREAYSRATGKVSTKPVDATQKKRMPGPDDDCPICYENMDKSKATDLEFCADCGNALHKECFGQWARTARSKGNPVTCVFCRADWAIPAVVGSTSAARMSRNGYLNLAGAAGLSPVRDTSTYYQGPRRGQRYYGYQEYYD